MRKQDKAIGSMGRHEEAGERRGQQMKARAQESAKERRRAQERTGAKRQQKAAIGKDKVVNRTAWARRH
eukprot:8025180-Alexandrium_andersonii.AAC.1